MREPNDLIIHENERILLIRIMNDVLSDNVFFSSGEMSTITCWSVEDVKNFIKKLKIGMLLLYPEEQRFLIHAIVAWCASVKYKQIDASSLDVYLSKEICDRVIYSRSNL